MKRRDDIILFMQQQGYITQAEAEAAWATPLNLVEKTTDENAAVQTDYSWFTDQVISEVIDDLVAENPLGRENWTARRPAIICTTAACASMRRWTPRCRPH